MTRSSILVTTPKTSTNNARLVKLLGESALRKEVVRNYKAFMHATEEIRTMEAGIQTLKDLLGSTAVTLQTFRGVHLVESVKPADKNASVRLNSRAMPSISGTAGDHDDERRDMDGVAASRGLKLPEWLDQAPIELIGTAKQAIDVSVLYPKQWTVTKTPGKGISIQDYKYTDRAFSLSRPLPSGKKGVDDLAVSFYTDVLFNLDGPYGNFGKVDDFKVVGAKTETKGKRTYRYVDLKFSAPTQGLLQVERRACVASTIVGGDVVIFTASVLASRWGKIAPIIGEMIESNRADVPQKTPDPSSFAFNRS